MVAKYGTTHVRCRFFDTSTFTQIVFFGVIMLNFVLDKPHYVLQTHVIRDDQWTTFNAQLISLMKC